LPLTPAALTRDPEAVGCAAAVREPDATGAIIAIAAARHSVRHSSHAAVPRCARGSTGRRCDVGQSASADRVDGVRCDVAGLSRRRRGRTSLQKAAWRNVATRRSHRRAPRAACTPSEGSDRALSNGRCCTIADADRGTQITQRAQRNDATFKHGLGRERHAAQTDMAGRMTDARDTAPNTRQTTPDPESWGLDQLST